jgi:predicted ATPase
VCSDAEISSASVLDIVDRLVAKSIVIPELRGAAMRYRMLVSIRAYSAHLLDDRGEGPATRRRHRDHYLAGRRHGRAVVRHAAARAAHRDAAGLNDE